MRNTSTTTPNRRRRTRQPAARASRAAHVAAHGPSNTTTSSAERDAMRASPGTFAVTTLVIPLRQPQPISSPIRGACADCFLPPCPTCGGCPTSDCGNADQACLCAGADLGPDPIGDLTSPATHPPEPALFVAPAGGWCLRHGDPLCAGCNGCKACDDCSCLSRGRPTTPRLAKEVR